MPTSGSGAAAAVVTPGAAPEGFDFSFRRLSRAWVPADSVEFFEISVSAVAGGAPVPAAQLALVAVSVAFSPSPRAGVPRQFRPAERPSPGLARLLLGGPSGISLPPGAYYVFVRAASAPESEVTPLDGLLRVF